ncbi:TIGR01459 family HAD-type hydrolase [Mesorhizobium sp. CAU 1741]|uniref:TIGR01459 family HAD-type hydrolase n=1 Tax=Mesorhizobium sp. CAU 1741 TaxID=3140366 RepID=UPI00325A7D38
MPNMIDTLDSIADGYAAIFSDVWGVVHNGVHPFEPAVDALRRARARGIAVVLITNAPRPSAGVIEQLAAIGVARDCWDAIVTSGDVTRDLIRDGSRRILHIGPDRDMMLYDELDVELAEEFEAQAVVCTGLYDDEAETPEDYAELLMRLRARDLPFICANPDIVVERGDRLIWCAGAIARDYAQLGGRTRIAGKPHRPIYEAAMRAAQGVLGRDVAKKDILAIGDGVLTDIKGASDNGFDVLFVSAGIHAAEFGEAHAPEPGKLAAFLEKHGYGPVAVIPRLR